MLAHLLTRYFAALAAVVTVGISTELFADGRIVLSKVFKPAPPPSTDFLSAESRRDEIVEELLRPLDQPKTIRVMVANPNSDIRGLEDFGAICDIDFDSEAERDYAFERILHYTSNDTVTTYDNADVFIVILNNVEPKTSRPTRSGDNSYQVDIYKASEVLVSLNGGATISLAELSDENIQIERGTYNLEVQEFEPSKSRLITRGKTDLPIPFSRKIVMIETPSSEGVLFSLKGWPVSAVESDFESGYIRLVTHRFDYFDEAELDERDLQQLRSASFTLQINNALEGAVSRDFNRNFLEEIRLENIAVRFNREDAKFVSDNAAEIDAAKVQVVDGTEDTRPFGKLVHVVRQRCGRVFE